MVFEERISGAGNCSNVSRYPCFVCVFVVGYPSDEFFGHITTFRRAVLGSD